MSWNRTEKSETGVTGFSVFVCAGERRVHLASDLSGSATLRLQQIMFGFFKRKDFFHLLAASHKRNERKQAFNNQYIARR